MIRGILLALALILIPGASLAEVLDGGASAAPSEASALSPTLSPAGERETVAAAAVPPVAPAATAAVPPVAPAATAAVPPVAPAATAAIAPATVKVEQPASQPALLHVSALAFGDFIARQGGGELGVAFTVSELERVYFDLGAAAVLGTNVGVRVTLALTTREPWRGGIKPFGQLRGILHPVPAGLGVGGGLLLGGTIEAGPGRFLVGLEAELISGPARYYTGAVMAVGGYQVDLFKPAPPAPVVVAVREPPAPVKEVPVEVAKPVVVAPPPPAPRAFPSAFKGTVTDMNDQPVADATITFPGRQGEVSGKMYDANPRFEIGLEPGEYRVEASAPGYLVRARGFKLSEGETLTYDFQLRPIPKVRSAELTDKSITISQRIQFEFDKFRILPESFFILDEVVDIMIHNPALQVRVEGHTDDKGSPDYNLTLSEGRAKAVVEYLMEKGIEGNRLVGIGYGLRKPLTTNKTEEGRAKNRRVQFEIVRPLP